jgi:copper(I)-binding protein
MMRTRLMFLLVLTLVLTAPTRHHVAQNVSAVSAWIVPPEAGATGASAHVELNNPTMYDVYVVSATAGAVAASVELRSGAAPGDTPVTVKEFAIPAYGSIDAVGSAPHLRLVGLKRPLAPGEMVELTLTTDTGAVLTVRASVRTP